jgi:hypothetical protein
VGRGIEPEEEKKKKRRGEKESWLNLPPMSS